MTRRTLKDISFVPMPWLSVITAIGLAILISLAVWQYHRLDWKTAFLAEVEQAVNAPPITSLDGLRRAITAGEPVDFRRIDIDAKIVKDVETKLVYSSQRGGVFWRGFTPIIETQSGGMIFAALDSVEDKNRDIYKARPIDKLVGYVRFAHPMGWMEAKFKAKPNVDENKYFKFNQTGDWDKALPANSYYIGDYYLDASFGALNAEGLPIKRPKIRNNHFDYMLTWSSFAIILLIFYVILHIRAGRLSWKNKLPQNKPQQNKTHAP